MTTHNFVLRTTVAAVQAALMSMLAVATANAQSDATVAELTTPDKVVEGGVIYTSKDSFKFGEYNGLQDKGFHGVLNLDLNGKGGDDSPLFWSVQGTDLGLDTRRLDAQGGQQGLFNLHLLYDELPHKISDTYHTIFNGAGGTSLTLPGSYPAPGTRAGSTSSAANALANWNNIQAPNAVSGTPGGGPGYLIPSLMHEQEVGTKRKKIEGGISVNLTPEWEARVTARQDRKDGTKLTGFAFNSASTAAMLVEPIDFRTNGFDLALVFKGEKANFNFDYSYSAFKNNISSWTAQTPFAGATGTTGVYNNQALMSSAPESIMNQFKLSGGYRFTSTTRLSFEGSRSRTTQNSPFNCQVTNGALGCTNGVNGWIIPVSSADAKVVNDTVFVKLTSRPLTELSVNASYKYDRRDNQTPVNTFRVNFADAMGAASNTIANDPINTTKNLFNLEGDYTFARGQAVKLGLQQENIDRTTDGSGFAPSRTQATANTNDFSLPTHKTRETTLGAEYRNSVIPDLTGRIGFWESRRKAQDYAQATLAASSTTVDATASALTNAYYLAFRDFFVANRTRDKLRGGLNYQASDTVSLGFSADYNNDKYDDAAVQEVKSTILNFDVAFTPSETLSINPYYTYEDRKTRLKGKYITIVGSTNAGATQFVRLNGGPVQSCGNGVGASPASCVLANGDWNLQQADRVDTLGIAVKQKGLMAGNLDLGGDLLYIYSKTPVTAASSVGALVSDGAAGTGAGTAINYTSVAASSFPDITSKTVQLKLMGTYRVDKTQTVRVSYLFQRLISSDWQYDAYTNPIAMQAYIGTAMTAPRYTVNAIGATYSYSFK